MLNKHREQSLSSRKPCELSGELLTSENESIILRIKLQNIVMDTVGEAAEYRKARLPFTVDEKLGSGAFGEVFKATVNENEGKSRTIAVKYIKCTTGDEIQNAMGEILALTALCHKNVLKIFDFGLRQHWQLEVEFSILMEYCTNGSLKQQLGERHSRSRKLGWICGMTSGIVHLHSKGIVHQDLKPDNILLTGNDVVKVADFGLARRFARQTKDQSWHAYYLDEGVGSRFYAAPEMLEERHTHEVDVFSMGILFHAIIDGQYKDHNGERHYGVFVETNQHTREPIGIQMYEEKKDLKVPFPRWRRRLIERMLKYDPEERPTAVEVDGVLQTTFARWFQLV